MPILEEKVIKTTAVVSEEILEALSNGEFEVSLQATAGGGYYMSTDRISYEPPSQVIHLETAKHRITIAER